LIAVAYRLFEIDEQLLLVRFVQREVSGSRGVVGGHDASPYCLVRAAPGCKASLAGAGRPIT
jgi:hypothetical protein